MMNSQRPSQSEISCAENLAQLAMPSELATVPCCSLTNGEKHAYVKHSLSLEARKSSKRENK